MPEALPADKPTHVARVRPGKGSRSLRVLPSDARESWPANLGEVLEWYTKEVQDVTKAAEIRLQDASKVISELRSNKITFEEAVDRVSAHDMKWGQKFPGQIEDVIRGQSDEEISKAVTAARESRNR